MQTINLMNVLEREFGYNGSANCIRKPRRVSVSVISNPFPYTRVEIMFTYTNIRHFRMLHHVQMTLEQILDRNIVRR